MARSSGTAASGVVPGEFRHSASGVSYKVSQEHGAVFMRYRQERTARTVEGERRLDYFIGSGGAGRSYLYSRDGFLFQAPITWYAAGSRWDMSPGYAKDTDVRFDRAVEPKCLSCHASGIQALAGTVNRYSGRPFQENGVSCERCHGPGGDHIRGEGRMTNPAKLDPARRDSVCQQCHLSGEAAIALVGWDEQQFRTQFRPSELLSSVVAVFVGNPEEGVAVKAASHVERFEQSLCKKASGTRLWCGSCHDPHTTRAPAERIAYYRAKCEGCHAPSVQAAGLTYCPRSADCVGCHMPKSPVFDGGHGVLTEHRITRRPVKGNSEFQASTLQLFGGFSATAREVGLAYAELAARSPNPEVMRRAASLLQKAYEEGDRDAVLTSKLAWIEQRAGHADSASKLYILALEKQPWSDFASGNLGVLEARRGRIEKAVLLWEQALQSNPGNVVLLRNLRDAFKWLGRPESAERMQKELEFFIPTERESQVSTGRSH